MEPTGQHGWTGSYVEVSLTDSVGRLAGKVALITGGGSGIGLAVVQRFIEEGARVCVMGRSEQRLDAVRQRFGGAVTTTQGDVARLADNRRAVSETTAAFGQLDILVGNAGVFDNFVRLRDIPDSKFDAAFDELFSTNVKGYLLGVKAALPELDKTEGSVIFTASTSSVAPGFGGIFYVTAKHAVVGLTKELAWELAPKIRVNAVALGYVPTELGALQALGQERGTAPPEAVLPRIPLRYVPAPEDVAGLYVTLAAPRDNRFLTGTVLLADGGQVMWGPPH